MHERMPEPAGAVRKTGTLTNGNVMMLQSWRFFSKGKIMKLVQKRNTLFSSLFQTSIIFILGIVAVACIVIAFENSRFNIQEKGNTRIEVLQQISESNTVSRQNIENIMNMVYDSFLPLLTLESSPAMDQTIQNRLEEMSGLISKIGMPLSIDIVMNDKRIYTTSSSDMSINSLKSTYWYIKHYAGEIETSWNFRFSDTNERSRHGLSYGRTIYDNANKPIGVIVVTSESLVLFRALKDMTEKSMVYILDSNGIIISHSNPNRIGNWGASMAAFEETYGFNSYNVIQKNGRQIMLSNYHDPESGWTFVEEQSIDSLLAGTRAILVKCMLIIVFGAVVFILFAYKRIRINTNALNRLTNQIAEMSHDDLDFVDVDQSYQEIYILSQTFNDMIAIKRELISEIQRREDEKRKTEYDFLLAQINPHFLNNTLVAIKSLLTFHQTERAEKMMEQLVELLHIPADAKIRFITLRDEIHLEEVFLDIMDNRFARKTNLQCKIDDELLDYKIPRLILEPILENSVFHGFAGKEDNCIIEISASSEENIFRITIRDNGCGIPEDRLAMINTGDYHDENPRHGIALPNIRKRLQIIFGELSDVLIRSIPDEGTTVTLVMDPYHEIIEPFAADKLPQGGAK